MRTKSSRVSEGWAVLDLSIDVAPPSNGEMTRVCDPNSSDARARRIIGEAEKSDVEDRGGIGSVPGKANKDEPDPDSDEN